MTLHDLAEHLMSTEKRSDTPFGLYVVRGSEPAAELGRAVEREVFFEYFGNTESLLVEEYDPYEEASLFLVVLDHLQRRPAGVMRILLPSPAGFKSLDDLERAWGEPASAVLARCHVDFDREALWDVATLAVTKDYRGAASAGVVSLGLYQGLAMLAVLAGVRHVIAILDLVVLDMAQQAFHRPWTGLPGLEPKRYLDSPSSLPIYTDVAEYEARLRLLDANLHALLFEGRGLEAVLSLPPLTDDTVVSRRLLHAG